MTTKQAAVAPVEEVAAAPVVDAPTAPSFAASKSNIAYMKAPANPMGALNTGMGYDPEVLVTATVNTQLIGGAAEVIGYSAPTAQ